MQAYVETDSGAGIGLPWAGIGVSPDRMFCCREYFYNSGSWQRVCQCNQQPGLYGSYGAYSIYGNDRNYDTDSVGCNADVSGSEDAVWIG